MSRFDVLILGNSSALPAYNRHPSAQLINIHEQLLLIDCGEGTQDRLIKHRVKSHKINHIFISHLHGDHYFGLPGLITSLNLTGRKDPLHIYSPPGLDKLIIDIIGLADGHLNFEIFWKNLTGDESMILLDDGVKKIMAFPLKHRIATYGFVIKEAPGKRAFDADKFIELPSYKVINKLKQGLDVLTDDGELFKYEDYTLPPRPSRKYSYCSDTAYEPGLVAYIEGSDTLYHEATYAEIHLEKAKENFHSTAIQAANIALKSKAKKLIIGHFSSRYKSLDMLLEEARSVFAETVLAVEGHWYPV
ncbi:MAG: ribonuclease Z [Saprospiraceae bacterium]